MGEHRRLLWFGLIAQAVEAADRRTLAAVSVSRTPPAGDKARGGNFSRSRQPIPRDNRWLPRVMGERRNWGDTRSSRHLIGRHKRSQAERRSSGL